MAAPPKSGSVQRVPAMASRSSLTTTGTACRKTNGPRCSSDSREGRPRRGRGPALGWHWWPSRPSYMAAQPHWRPARWAVRAWCCGCRDRS